MPAITADDLYEMTKQLSTNDRLRLVEKIARSLAAMRDPALPPAPPAPVSGVRTRTQLVGQVTDIAVDPLRLTIRTSRGDVSVTAGADLLDHVYGAWGREVIADVEAFLDIEGGLVGAAAISLDLAAEADDVLSNFESTFGSGSELWSTPEARRALAATRGGGA